MSECAYESCNREIVGSVLWDSGTMRNYCQKHLRDSKTQFPELVEEIELV